MSLVEIRYTAPSHCSHRRRTVIDRRLWPWPLGRSNNPAENCNGKYVSFLLENHVEPIVTTHTLHVKSNFVAPSTVLGTMISADLTEKHIYQRSQFLHLPRDATHRVTVFLAISLSGSMMRTNLWRITGQPCGLHINDQVHRPSLLVFWRILGQHEALAIRRPMTTETDTAPDCVVPPCSKPLKLRGPKSAGSMSFDREGCWYTAMCLKKQVCLILEVLPSSDTRRLVSFLLKERNV